MIATTVDTHINGILHVAFLTIGPCTTHFVMMVFFGLVTLLHGIQSAAVHSEMAITERDQILNAFDQGQLRILTNVNVLTEGWDSPRADCIMLCRPTLSTALYVQMVGRGLRIHPQKKDCLVLDLAGCFQRHGSIKCPLVRLDNEILVPEEKKLREKHCPECSEVIPLSSLACPYCDRELKAGVVFLDEEQNMVHIDDRPEDVVLCEECCRPYPWKDCTVEWLSYDIDASTPGIIYCPKEHLIQALDRPYLITEPGHYDILHLKSKLRLDGEEVGLSIALTLCDGRRQPCFIEFVFLNSDDDSLRLKNFIQTLSHNESEDFGEHEAFGLPSKINRHHWDLSKGLELEKNAEGELCLASFCELQR